MLRSMTQTRDERNAKKREWYAANRERLQAEDRARYAADPTTKIAKVKAWRDANPDRVRESKRAWAAAHPEQGAARSKAWHEANRDLAIARAKAWQAANPEQTRATQRKALHRRRALLAGTESPGVSPAEWAAVVEFFDGCCAYCGKPGAELDHVIPISRGGRDALDNVQPACRKCNASKNSKLLDEWLATSAYARRVVWRTPNDLDAGDF